MKEIVLAFSLLVAFFTTAFAETFFFTAIPDQDESRLRSRFDKVANYLAEKLS